MPDQNGEGKLVEAYFAGQRGGYVVDVGAADGYTNSNSEFLLNDYGWSGVLIDPLPAHAAACRERYAGRADVVVIEGAVAEAAGPLTIYPGHGFDASQGTTALVSWRDRVTATLGVQYDAAFVTQARPLTQILDDLGAPQTIDFLTVDCEGMDMEALRSLDWDRYTVRLCCVEARPDWASLVEYMGERGLHVVGVTNGNTLFGR